MVTKNGIICVDTRSYIGMLYVGTRGQYDVLKCDV